MATIRREMPEDAAAIRRVLTQTFGQPDEADLVDVLRRREAITLSLVAVEDDLLVGHILFSPVTIEAAGGSFAVVGLGPMAVLPPYQNRGIGSSLAQTGLQECRNAGHDAVVVLGHPEYYPRFGFTPASAWGIQCEFDAPDGAFMVMELREGALAGRSGVARYRPEFTGLSSAPPQ